MARFDKNSSFALCPHCKGLLYWADEKETIYSFRERSNACLVEAKRKKAEKEKNNKRSEK